MTSTIVTRRLRSVAVNTPTQLKACAVNSAKSYITYTRVKVVHCVMPVPAIHALQATAHATGALVSCSSSSRRGSRRGSSSSSSRLVVVVVVVVVVV